MLCISIHSMLIYATQGGLENVKQYSLYCSCECSHSHVNVQDSHILALIQYTHTIVSKTMCVCTTMM